MTKEIEKAQIMRKLARKDNWNACYDRLEYFKRFPNLDECIKDLSKSNWLIIHKKPNYTGISLNSHYKKEIIEFIETKIPGIKGFVK